MSITFTMQGNNYTFDEPEYGYTSSVALAIHRAPVLPRGYAPWDDGSSFDVRTCNVTFIMNATDANSLLGVWKDADKGRGVTGSLVLPSASGFYPFGPDYGDAGTFGVRMIDLEPGPPLEEPWLYFRNTIRFVMTSHPAYGLPTQQAEGDLTIGAVSGLRYPPEFTSPEIRYAVATVLTRNGTPYTVDRLPSSDVYETTLNMVLRQNKAAALLNHLVATVRANNVTITDGGNGYLFGRSAGQGAALTCQWVNEVVNVRHRRFDEFEMPLTFYLTTVVS